MTSLVPALRTLILLIVCLAASAPLALWSGTSGAPPVSWFTGPLLLGVLLAGALQSWNREVTEDVDDPVTARFERYSPLALGHVLAGAVAFPSLWTWSFLWSLCFLQLPLVLFWHVARPRTISLCIASVAALGATVLVDDAAPALAVVALGWLLIPALDALTVGRDGAASETRLPAAQLVLVITLLLALGGGLFALGQAILPASARGFSLDPSLTDPGSRTLDDVSVSELPVSELVVFLAVVLALMALTNLIAGGATAGSAVVEDDAPMQVDEAQPLPVASGRSPPAWPAGPRRDLVERYLGHLDALDELGFVRQPGQTPSNLASALPPQVVAEAEDLARLFGEARWAPSEVSAQAFRRADEVAERVESGIRTSDL